MPTYFNPDLPIGASNEVNREISRRDSSNRLEESLFRRAFRAANWNARRSTNPMWAERALGIMQAARDSGYRVQGFRDHDAGRAVAQNQLSDDFQTSQAASRAFQPMVPAIQPGTPPQAGGFQYATVPGQSQTGLPAPGASTIAETNGDGGFDTMGGEDLSKQSIADKVQSPGALMDMARRNEERARLGLPPVKSPGIYQNGTPVAGPAFNAARPEPDPIAGSTSLSDINATRQADAVAMSPEVAKLREERLPLLRLDAAAQAKAKASASKENPYPAEAQRLRDQATAGQEARNRYAELSRRYDELNRQRDAANGYDQQGNLRPSAKALDVLSTYAGGLPQASIPLFLYGKYRNFNEKRRGNELLRLAEERNAINFRG